MNKNLIFFCIETIVKLMSPITSYVCEYIWRIVLKHQGPVFDYGIPDVPHDFDMTIIQSKAYVSRVLKDFKNLRKPFLKRNKGKEPKEARVYIYRECPEWKAKTISILKDVYDPVGKSFPKKDEFMNILEERAPELIEMKSEVMPVYSDLGKKVKMVEDPESLFNLTLPFNEMDVFRILNDYFIKELNIEQIRIFYSDDENIPDNLSISKSNKQPGEPALFFA